MTSSENWWDRFWYTPQPAHRLALVRILAPLAILGLLSSRLAFFDAFFTRDGFHLPPLHPGSVNQPVYLAPLGDGSALVITLLLVVSGLALAAGYRTRLANIVFAALVAYVALFDRIAAVSVNKLGTVVIVALCFAPSGIAYSLDARRARSPGRQAPPAEVPGVVVRFLQIQLVVLYAASGYCKAFQGDWLKNGYVLWSQIHGHYQTFFSYWAGRLLPPWAWPALQWPVLAYESFAPLLLSVRRTRTPTVIFGLCMHLAVGLLFRRLIYFSLLMIALLTLFLPDGAQRALLALPRTVSDRLRRRAPPARPPEATSAAAR